MVLGTPTTRACCSASRAATLSVSSPPMATSASRCSRSMLRRTSSMPCSSFIGFTRELPSMVPPSWRMPESFERSRLITSPSPIMPAHPLRIPNSESPAASARLPIARMAALRPGASPPPVRMAILCPTLPLLSAGRLLTDPGITEERLLFGAAEYDGHAARRGGRGGGGRRGHRRGRRRLGGDARRRSTWPAIAPRRRPCHRCCRSPGSPPGWARCRRPWSRSPAMCMSDAQRVVALLLRPLALTNVTVRAVGERGRCREDVLDEMRRATCSSGHWCRGSNCRIGTGSRSRRGSWCHRC